MSRCVKNKNPTRTLYMIEMWCIEIIKLLPVYITLHIRTQQPGVGSLISSDRFFFQYTVEIVDELFHTFTSFPVTQQSNIINIFFQLLAVLAHFSLSSRQHVSAVTAGNFCPWQHYLYFPSIYDSISLLYGRASGIKTSSWSKALSQEEYIAAKKKKRQKKKDKRNKNTSTCSLVFTSGSSSGGKLQK